MAINTKIIQHDDFIEVVVSGDFEMQDAIDEFPKVLSICNSTKISKVLIDFREIKGSPAVTEKILYTFGSVDYYENYISNGGQELKIAYVGAAPFVNTYEEELDYVKLRNLTFDLFTEINKAYKWLDIKHSST